MFHCVTVSGVLLGAILLFVFGFKATEEPSFSKIKTESKLNAKKKKGKEKKSVSGSPKTNATGKTKTAKSDDKVKKSGSDPLKDSKKVNVNTKGVNEEFFVKERKKKGKENVDVRNDSNDEDDGWEQALSRKDRKNKKSPTLNQVSKRNAKELNYDSGTTSKKELENVKNKSAQKEKKQRSNDGEDLGVWQEAKTGKKRRKIQKEA